MSKQEFVTVLTVACLFPRPNQINMAIYIGSHFRGLGGALAALAGILLLPFSVLMGLGLAYYYLHTSMATDRLLAGLIKASAGMALSMGFKIAAAYLHDRVALLLAAISFVAMTVCNVRLVPLVLVAGPLAMAWYWPRKP